MAGGRGVKEGEAATPSPNGILGIISKTLNTQPLVSGKMQIFSFPPPPGSSSEKSEMKLPLPVGG